MVVFILRGRGLIFRVWVLWQRAPIFLPHAIHVGSCELLVLLDAHRLLSKGYVLLVPGILALNAWLKVELREMVNV